MATKETLHEGEGVVISVHEVTREKAPYSYPTIKLDDDLYTDEIFAAAQQYLETVLEYWDNGAGDGAPDGNRERITLGYLVSEGCKRLGQLRLDPTRWVDPEAKAESAERRRWNADWNKALGARDTEALKALKYDENGAVTEEFTAWDEKRKAAALAEEI